MEEEFEDLESLFSDHFGKTPVTTPNASQELDEDVDEDGEEDCPVNVDAVVQGRARDFLAHQESDTDVTVDEDEVAISDDYMKVCRFVSDGCGCQLNCHKSFSTDEIYSHVLNVKEMQKEEKDMYIMGTVNECDSDKTKKGKKRQRMFHSLKFHGKTVCRKAFLLCYDVGRVALQNLLTHLAEHGVTPRTHGNMGKVKSHALSYDDVQRVVRFISNHADIHGLPQPAAPRGRDNIPPVYLSADTTKYGLHANYVTSAAEGDHPCRAVKLSTFKTIWLQCLPHIRIATPRDDVCASCEKLRKMVADAVDEDDKLHASTMMRDHVIKAQQERDLYNECVRRSVETRESEGDERYTHFTFDFAQCVSLPHFARQMGPLYFLSLRKVQIFGFRVDGIPLQLNFLVNEGETMGGDGGDTHGPNSVISMVDYGMERNSRGIMSCSIHADNCPGQNKNRYVLGYFAWRVMTGQQNSIEYLMQIPGHSRCLVDGGFGHIKRMYRRCDCSSMDQLEALVNKSASTNIAVRYPQWQWRNWKSFISTYFKPLNGIRKYQYFRFIADEPGVVSVREERDGCETKFQLLKDAEFRFRTADRPAPVASQGISNARQDYLTRSVRPFIPPAMQQAFC